MTKILYRIIAVSSGVFFVIFFVLAVFFTDKTFLGDEVNITVKTAEEFLALAPDDKGHFVVKKDDYYKWRGEKWDAEFHGGESWGDEIDDIFDRYKELNATFTIPQYETTNRIKLIGRLEVQCKYAEFYDDGQNVGFEDKKGKVVSRYYSKWVYPESKRSTFETFHLLAIVSIILSGLLFVLLMVISYKDRRVENSKEKTNECPECGGGLSKYQIDLKRNPTSPMWRRKGYCSLKCFNNGKN